MESKSNRLDIDVNAIELIDILDDNNKHIAFDINILDTQQRPAFSTQDVMTTMGIQPNSQFNADVIKENQLLDSFCLSIIKRINSNNTKDMKIRQQFMLDSDGLLRKKRKSGNKFINSVVQIVLPNVMIKEVLDYYHSSLDGGHIGHNKLETNVSKLFWFPQLRCKVRAHVRLCTICQRIKPSFKTPYGVSHVIESPTQPFESVNIDTMGPIATSTKGNVHIIVCVDRLTRFLIAAPIPDIKATTVAKFLYNEVILKYNCPKRLTSDRGKCFMSKLFQDFLKNMSITHCPTASYYASSDGLSEINNRKLIHIIRGYVNHKSDNWDQYISAAVKIINRNVNSTTGYSPFFLLYGYKPFNVFERKLGIQNLESVPDSQETDEYSLNTLQKAREEAIENVMEAEQKWAKLRNQNLRTPPFEVGDIVYVTDRSIEVGTHKKFKPTENRIILYCKRSNQRNLSFG